MPRRAQPGGVGQLLHLPVNEQPEVVARWGEETARVWDLYLTGGTRSFAEGRMGVEQFVLRRPEQGPEQGFAL